MLPCFPCAHKHSHWLDTAISGNVGSVRSSWLFQSQLGLFLLLRPWWTPILPFTAWERCFLSVMSSIWQSPASASSLPSKPIYCQFIHFIAVRWWQHFEVFAKGGLGGSRGRGGLIECISLFPGCPKVKGSQIWWPRFVFFSPSIYHVFFLTGSGFSERYRFISSSFSQKTFCLLDLGKKKKKSVMHASTAPCLYDGTDAFIWTWGES